MKHADQIEREEAILRELMNYGGNPSCDSFNYKMRRVAEMFFPVWDKDRSFAMFDKCCEFHCLSDEQKRIVRECMENHEMIEP